MSKNYRQQIGGFISLPNTKSLIEEMLGIKFILENDKYIHRTKHGYIALYRMGMVYFDLHTAFCNVFLANENGEYKMDDVDEVIGKTFIHLLAA